MNTVHCPGFYDPYILEIGKKYLDAIVPQTDPKNGLEGDNIILMFINERPGRVGPGNTGLISFDNPDPTANRFKRLFNMLEIDRKKIFITNACIFYSSELTYRDKVPNKEEISLSTAILKDQLKRINPKIIVPMGNFARNMLKKVYLENEELRSYRLKQKIGSSIKNEPLIYPLYHTSNRATISRQEIDQETDWKNLKKNY